MSKVIYPNRSLPIIIKKGSVEIRHKSYHDDGRVVIADDNTCMEL